MTPEVMLIDSIENHNLLNFHLALTQVTDLNKKMYNELWPLAAALVYERNDMMQILLEQGADSNYGGVLYDAVMGDKFEVVQILIEVGADLNQCSKYNVPPIYFAIENDSPEMVSFLLKHGAVIQDKEDYLPLAKSPKVYELIANS